MDPMMMMQAMGPKRAKAPVTSRTLPLSARPNGLSQQGQAALLQLLQGMGMGGQGSMMGQGGMMGEGAGMMQGMMGPRKLQGY